MVYDELTGSPIYCALRGYGPVPPGIASPDSATRLVILSIAGDHLRWGPRQISADLRFTGHDVPSAVVQLVLEQHPRETDRPAPNPVATKRGRPLTAVRMTWLEQWRLAAGLRRLGHQPCMTWSRTCGREMTCLACRWASQPLFHSNAKNWLAARLQTTGPCKRDAGERRNLASRRPRTTEGR